jgi:hypothetical protein
VLIKSLVNSWKRKVRVILTETIPKGVTHNLPTELVGSFYFGRLAGGAANSITTQLLKDIGQGNETRLENLAFEGAKEATLGYIIGNKTIDTLNL